MQTRLKKAVFGVIAFLATGVCYALFVFLTGWSIPCVFNLITGLKCPGCGVTKMCLSLIRLDIGAAFKANPAILLLSPLMAFTAGRMLYVYIKYDRHRETFTQISVYFMLVVLVLFGILRNIL
jgi:hypothetical protein